MSDQTTDDRPDETAGAGAIWALLLTVAGGLIGLIGYVVDWPDAVWVTAVCLFGAGTALACFLTYRDARARAVPFWRSMGRALRAAGSWIFWWMP